MNKLTRYMGLDDMTRGAKHGFLYVFALVFAVGFASFALSARSVNDLRHITATVKSEHHVQLYACSLGNESRAQQLTLWKHIIRISPPPAHETAAERKARLARISGFLAYVNRIFAPRDCAAINRIKPPP